MRSHFGSSNFDCSRFVSCPHCFAIAMAVVAAGGSRCFVYSYTNYDLVEHRNCTLWECEGEIMFQSRSFTTVWHGVFTRQLEDFHVSLLFDCHGRRPWKSANLCRVSPVCWYGRDYLQRRVQLDLIEVISWENGGWHLV